VDKKLRKHLSSTKLSSFKKKVLSAVCEIPPGEVKSYKWVAKKINCPNSSRGVGRALSRNPFPFIIPCHRVVRSDHSLGGFMFGAKVKKELLVNEGLTVKKEIVIIPKRGKG